jgi:hypothetical protein
MGMFLQNSVTKKNSGNSTQSLTFVVMKLGDHSQISEHDITIK